MKPNHNTFRSTGAITTVKTFPVFCEDALNTYKRRMQIIENLQKKQLNLDDIHKILQTRQPQTPKKVSQQLKQFQKLSFKSDQATNYIINTAKAIYPIRFFLTDVKGQLILFISFTSQFPNAINHQVQFVTTKRNQSFSCSPKDGTNPEFVYITLEKIKNPGTCFISFDYLGKKKKVKVLESFRQKKKRSQSQIRNATKQQIDAAIQRIKLRSKPIGNNFINLNMVRIKSFRQGKQLQHSSSVNLANQRQQRMNKSNLAIAKKQILDFKQTSTHIIKYLKKHQPFLSKQINQTCQSIKQHKLKAILSFTGLVKSMKIVEQLHLRISKEKIKRTRVARINAICGIFAKKLYKRIKRWKLTMRALKKLNISNCLNFYGILHKSLVKRRSTVYVGNVFSELLLSLQRIRLIDSFGKFNQQEKYEGQIKKIQRYWKSMYYTKIFVLSSMFQSILKNQKKVLTYLNNLPLQMKKQHKKILRQNTIKNFMRFISKDFKQRKKKIKGWNKSQTKVSLKLYTRKKKFSLILNQLCVKLQKQHFG